MISPFFMSWIKNPSVQVSLAIVSIAVILASGLYFLPAYSHATGPATAIGCGGTVIANINCSAGEAVPMDCEPTSMAYEYTEETQYICNTTGFYWSGNKGYCQPDPSCAACVPSAACAATTCSTTTCSDSCGNNYAGTQNCTPPPTTCADLGKVGIYPDCTVAPPPYTQSTYAPQYSESTYAPVGCGTPAANLTAAPTRVRSGQTSTLTLSATGVTTSCTITGPGINTTVAAPACVVNTTLATPPITSQVTYKVTCDGSTDIAKIIVNLAPRVNEF